MRFVYDSLAGRYSDSPRAIYEQALRTLPDEEHLWLAAAAHLAAFPAGTPTVEHGSRESVELLESADVVVGNTHIELEWAKDPGTTYLQTWHGTPLKRIHRDVPAAPPGRTEGLQRDVDRWDLLVSPNAPSTPLLRGAFGFEGEILETGYPRNDLLRASEREAVRARVRAQLGIPAEARAVLYAPTWRDDVILPESGGGTLELGLDVPGFVEALGSDHVLLLRLHYFVAGRVGTVEGPAVRDVSFHPEMGELYLAADVLVTDYSSAMFDFAVTGKPQLFLTYDLAHYRDSVRGFYFDLGEIAPGPLLETTSELVAALRDLSAVATRHERRYAAFQARFCHLEDGHAAQRVLQGVLAARAARRP